MPKTRLYIAPLDSELDEEAQEAAFSGFVFDEIIIEDALLADGSPKAWNVLVPHCKSGDHLALYSLKLLPLKPPALNRVLFDLLKAGVAIHLALPALIITPDDADPAFTLIRAYEAHRRSQLGREVSQALKSGVRPGRAPRLTVEQLPEIRSMLSDPTLTRGAISERLKVTQSTLFKFLAKHKDSADPGEEVIGADV